MNEVFLIGKIITEIDFKFKINSKKNKSIVRFQIESMNKQKICIIAYNEIADYCFRKLKKNGFIFIYGRINEEGVVIKSVKKCRNFFRLILIKVLT